MAQATAGRISAGKAFVEIVADKANLIKGLKSVQRDIKAFGQSLKDLGSDMFILGGFTSVPLLKSIKMFAEFDDRIRTLKGVSGATESTMQDLKETIMDLGATTAFTANQVAEGAIELARIGFEADEVKKAIKPTLDLVRATGESVNKLGEYAGYASSVLKIFKKNAEDFNNVTNIMAYSANRSAMSIADYYESMKMAGPYAQMVGEGIEGASSALMLMANMGVRGSLAGTSLRNVYQVLAATAGKLTDVTEEENNAIATNLESLETLGIRLKDTRGNLLSVAQIMDSIKNKLKEMPKNDKLYFLIEQFGLRGSLGASSMLNDYDNYFQNQEKALKNLLKAEREYKEKISKHQEGGAGGFLRGLISRWEAIQITVGEGFWETIKNASQAILGFVGGILKFIQENKKLVSSVVFATGSIFTLGITIFGVGMIIKILGASLGMVIVPLSILTKIVLTAGKAIYFLYVGLRTLTNFTPKAISKSLTWLKKYYEKTKNLAKISFDGVVAGFRKAIIVLDSLKKSFKQTYDLTATFARQILILSIQIKNFSKSTVSAFMACAVASGKAFNVTLSRELPILLNSLKQISTPVTRIAQGFLSFGSVFDVVTFKLYAFAANVNVVLMRSLKHINRYFAQFSKISLNKNFIQDTALVKKAGTKLSNIFKSLKFSAMSFGTAFSLMTKVLSKGGKAWDSDMTLFTANFSFAAGFKQLKKIGREIKQLIPLSGPLAKEFSNAFIVMGRSISAYSNAFIATAKKTKSLKNVFTVLGKSISLPFRNLKQTVSSSRSFLAIMDFLRFQFRETMSSLVYFAEGFRVLGQNLTTYTKGVAKISYNNIRFLATNKRLASSYTMLKASLTRFMGVMSLGTAAGATFGSVIMGAFAGLASSFIGATGVLVNFIGGFSYLKALGIQVGLTFLRIGKAIKEVALISFPHFLNGFSALRIVFLSFYRVIASGAIAVYQFINSMLGLKVAVAGIQLLYSKFLYTTSLLIYNMVTLAFSIFSLAKAKVALIALGKGLSFVISKVWLLLKAMFSLKNLKAIWIGLTMAVKGFWLAITLSIKGLLVLLTALKADAILSFLTPFLILGGAVATGVYVWKRYGNSMKAAFRNSKFLNNFKRDFSNAWKEIKDVGVKTFGALKEAFEVGDLIGGFKIAFASLKLILLESVQPFFNAWDKFFKQFSSGFNFLSNIFNKFSNTIDKLVYHHEYTMLSRKKDFMQGIEYTDPKTGKKRMVKSAVMEGLYDGKGDFLGGTTFGLLDKATQYAVENGNISPAVLQKIINLGGKGSKEDELFLRLYKQRENERDLNKFKTFEKIENQKPFTYNPEATKKTLKNAIADARAKFAKQLDLNASFAGNTRFLREIAEIFNNNAQEEYEMSFESVYKNNQIKRDMRRYDNMPNKTAEYELRTAIINVVSQINNIEKEFKKVQKESLTGHGDVIDANEQMRMIELIEQKGYLMTRKQAYENKLSGLNQTTGQAIQEKTQNAIGAWSFAELKNSFGKSIAQKTLDANLIANNYLRKIEKNSKKDLTSLGVQYL